MKRDRLLENENFAKETLDVESVRMKSYLSQKREKRKETKWKRREEKKEGVCLCEWRLMEKRYLEVLLTDLVKLQMASDE